MLLVPRHPSALLTLFLTAPRCQWVAGISATVHIMATAAARARLASRGEVAWAIAQMQPAQQLTDMSGVIRSRISTASSVRRFKSVRLSGKLSVSGSHSLQVAGQAGHGTRERAVHPVGWRPAADGRTAAEVVWQVSIAYCVPDVVATWHKGTSGASRTPLVVLLLTTALSHRL